MAVAPGSGARSGVRVATLLPSATEIVSALGLGDQLVGVSHSCSYPPQVRDLPRLTSTRVPYQEDSETIDTFVREHLDGNDALYDLDLRKLESARPDVVISQSCNAYGPQLKIIVHQMTGQVPILGIERI